MTRILIVDDDRQIAELIEVYLKNEGYQTDIASDGEIAFGMLERTSFDLIILDIMMPNMDGLELCQKVRQESHIPILMVSAKVGDMDKIFGLTTGGDDYLTKPFNPLELTARVKALLRRANYQFQGMAEDVIRVGVLVIDKKSHLVTVEGNIIKLTGREFDILCLLAQNSGRVYGSQEIFEKVWKEPGEGANRTVMVHISNLRDKLEAAIPGESIIQTVWGVGYKIEG
nr:response regulator transcription factor [Lysinibacillus timonensis]